MPPPSRTCRARSPARRFNGRARMLQSTRSNGATGRDRRRPVAIRHDNTDEMATPVQPRVRARHGNGLRVDVARQHRHPPQLRRRDGEDPGAAAEIEYAPESASGEELERPQAPSGRAVAAGAEGHRRLDVQRDQARRRRRCVFGLLNEEPADAERRKPVAVLREPIARGQRLDRDLRRGTPAAAAAMASARSNALRSSGAHAIPSSTQTSLPILLARPSHPSSPCGRGQG